MCMILEECISLINVYDPQGIIETAPGMPEPKPEEKEEDKEGTAVEAEAKEEEAMEL